MRYNQKQKQGSIPKIFHVLICLLMSCIATQVYAQTVSITGSLNAASVGQQTGCSLSASVDSAPTPEGEETLVPHWTWSGTIIGYSATEDGPYSGVSDGSQVNVVGNPDDTTGTATLTATFNSAGFYEVSVSASVMYADPTDGDENQGPYSASTTLGTAPDGDEGSSSGSAMSMSQSGSRPLTSQASPTMPDNYIEVSGPAKSVSFSSSSLIRLGLYSKNNTTTTLKATVTPASAAGEVTFSVTSGEATVSSTDEKDGDGDPTGVVDLTITAASATPATPASNATNGDAKLVATSSGTQLASVPVLVLEPAAIAEPKGTKFGGTVTGVNMAIGASSTPPNPFITPAGSVELYTVYDLSLTVHLADQFGNDLDTLFAGTEIGETATNPSNNQKTNVPINVTLGSTGTYTDVIGINSPYASNPANFDPGPISNTWVTNPSSFSPPEWALTNTGQVNGVLMPVQNDHQQIPVQVGGHTLNNQIDRTFTITATSPASSYSATISGVYN